VRDEPLPDIGTDPDYRFTLANERTFLAWMRTSLALVAAGVAVIQLLPEVGEEVEAYVVGVPLIGLGIVLPVMSFWRWEANERAMRLGVALPRTPMLRLLAGWITATALLAVVLLVIDGVA
jgi:putative membrane protein